MPPGAAVERLRCSPPDFPMLIASCAARQNISGKASARSAVA